MTKADIIRRGTSLGLDYGLTHSCSTMPQARPAAMRRCVLRARGLLSRCQGPLVAHVV